MSSREIEEKFTRSELTFVAWRSGEMAWQMDSRMSKSLKKKTPFDDTKPKTSQEIMQHYRDMGIDSIS